MKGNGRKVYILHCEFCGKDFETISPTRKWHNCEEALAQQRKIKNEFSRKWREQFQNKTDKPYRPTPRQKKIGWKRCISPNCTNLTPNYFGRCNSCLAEFERNYDIDCIAYLI